MFRRRLSLLALLLCVPPWLVVADDTTDDEVLDEVPLDEEEEEDDPEDFLYEDLDESTAPPDAGRRVQYRTRTEIDFDDLRIDAELSSPTPALLPARTRARFAPMIRGGGPAEISATPGGAQDARFLDRELDDDIIPRPEHFTAEGILSEHDLPVAADVACEQLLCAAGQAVLLERGQRLLAQPEVDALAQIGFASGLDPATWTRPPLNLVAVVDASGSMEGEPLATTKAALRLLVRRMEPGDHMTIVRFDESVHTLVRDGEPAELNQAIDRIVASNSTCVECGLKQGWAEATHTPKGFDGLSRVVLFTDEQPNVGTTSAAGFTQLLEQMAGDDIGVTTIGVASHFGVELAQAVSTVRGANLFYFEDLGEMRRVFDDELDTMLVPMAYSMELEVQPGDGWSLAGVYGLPGEALAWTRDGGIRLEVATLFPSRDKGGGIFLGFEQTDDGAFPDEAVARVEVRYETLEGRSPRSTLVLPVVSQERAALGLQRGLVLVDEITTLKAATLAHHVEGDDATAWRLLRDLEQRLDRVEDPDVRPEWERVAELLGLIEPLVPPAARLVSQRDPVSGLPRR
jgi:Ca-activated chloride channel homolog